MSEITWADLSDDTSRPELAAVWAALDTPVYRVLDEEGANVAGGQIRRLDRKHWLYVDDTDGYAVMGDAAACGLSVVAEADHVARGWDRNGNVVPL